MSYVTKYLTDITTLKTQLEKYPNKIIHYAKYDTFIGDVDSVKFINKKIQEYYDNT